MARKAIAIISRIPEGYHLALSIHANYPPALIPDKLAMMRKTWPEADLQILWQGEPERNSVDAVAEFHKGKGCCDGSDPAACHRRQVDAAEAERQRAKLQAIADRAPGPHEYDGADETYICHHDWHKEAHKMGDTCPRCGFVA